jgi:hypothetical protein
VQEVASSILASPPFVLLAPFLHPREPQQRTTPIRGGMGRSPWGTVSQSSRTRTKKCFASNEREKDLVRTGTRTQNLLLRRQAPYPLGHTDNYEFCFDHSPSRTRHSSLGVEHSLSKRKVVSSNLACGSQLLFALVFCSVVVGEVTSSLLQLRHTRDSGVRVV